MDVRAFEGETDGSEVVGLVIVGLGVSSPSVGASVTGLAVGFEVGLEDGALEGAG